MATATTTTTTTTTTTQIHILNIFVFSYIHSLNFTAYNKITISVDKYFILIYYISISVRIFTIVLLYILNFIITSILDKITFVCLLLLLLIRLQLRYTSDTYK